MKIICSLILTAVFFPCFTNLLHATEQKTLFKTESVQYKKGTGPKRCQAMCDAKSTSDVNMFLSEGWKVVSASPGKLIAERFRYTPCISCEPHECVCIGVEYVLEREKSASVVKIPENELNLLKRENESLKKENTTLKQESVPDSQQAREDGLDALKRENDSLKEENRALKRELENIRNRM